MADDIFMGTFPSNFVSRVAAQIESRFGDCSKPGSDEPTEQRRPQRWHDQPNDASSRARFWRACRSYLAAKSASGKMNGRAEHFCTAGAIVAIPDMSVFLADRRGIGVIPRGFRTEDPEGDRDQEGAETII